MNNLSNRICRVEESQTLKMTAKARELRAKGKDIISLSIGQPDFNTPDKIKEAAKKAIDDNFTGYTPVAGYRELREEISKKLKRENNLDYDFSQIVVSNGAKQSICNTMICLVNSGDEVIIPKPYWVSYKEIVSLCGGKSVFIETSVDEGFKFTAEQLEKVITPKTKVLIYSSPCNPSGAVLSKDELKKIANVIEKHPNLIVISDEIYEHINYVGKHNSIAQFENIKNQIVIINGVSKAYSMTGWRIGYIAAPKWIADACIKLQGQYTSGAGSISQKAAEAALKSEYEFTGEFLKIFEARKNLISKLAAEIPGLKFIDPEGTFYLFADMSYYLGKSNSDFVINNDDDFCNYLLENAEVATVPGTAFGTDNCFRISFADSEENITKAINRIKNALNLLK